MHLTFGSSRLFLARLSCSIPGITRSLLLSLQFKLTLGFSLGLSLKRCQAFCFRRSCFGFTSQLRSLPFCSALVAGLDEFTPRLSPC